MRIYNHNNMETLKVLEANSVDSVVTDPPYGLSFMNKKWDYEVPSIDFWKEVYRVLKPGGHILSFGGTRTYHRMVVNIEDAGFEIRDQIMWIYGSGFPKSLNIGKAVDKIEGNEREVVGDKQYKSINTKTTDIFLDDFSSQNRIQLKNTKGQTEYEGWGSSIKPANEPIVLARKPLSEKSIAENVMRWRTGGLNIDGCRIGNEGGTKRTGQTDKVSSTNPELSPTKSLNRTGHGVVELNEGRFPANVILECCCDEVIQGDIHTNPDCPCYIMDEQSGTRKSCKRTSKYNKETEHTNTYTPPKSDYRDDNTYSDMGGASRFFYRAKVSKKERNLGLDGFDENEVVRQGLAGEKNNPIHKNNHPTVKPINLLTYLCRLITPTNGIVLDPFMGSGSTGVAALLEGFDFIGMELEKDYYNIAKRRIEKYEEYKKIIK